MRTFNPINAGSMADIAFLLLIFFLVTTTINSDQGLLVKMPAWDDSPPIVLEESKVFTILINKQDQLMIEGAIVKNFKAIPSKLNNYLLRHQKKAIISLSHHEQTSYRRYIEVYDLIKKAYHQCWDFASLKQYGLNYNMLIPSQRRKIRQQYPFAVSEAESSSPSLFFN